MKSFQTYIETLKSIDADKIRDFLVENRLIKKPLTFVKEFIDDPQTTFNSLSTKEQIALVSGTSVVTFSTLAYIKFKYDYYYLLKAGYRPADTVSNVWQALGLRDINPSVNGFQLCKDTFTWNDILEFFTNMAIEHINFRSVLRFKMGAWYWIECSLLPDNEKDNKIINNNENIQLNQEFNRKQFKELYAFDIINHLQLGID